MSLTYPGGFITKNPTAPTSTSAPGIWTMDQALQYIKAGTWPTPPIGDPYWQNVALLSGTGSTNGAQNNTFIDSSSNNFTITRNGNTTQGTFTPFTAPNGYWGNYFDGSTDYLSTSSTQILPTGDFTIEAFIYFTGSFSTYPSIFAQGTAGDAGRTNLYLDPSGKLGFAIGSSVATSTGTVAANAWNYVAVTRSGSTVTFYINGSSSGTATNSGTPQNTGIRIGLDWNAGEEFTGYISNLRVSNNVRTITSTPTSPYTSDANTRLLTCQSNRFVDNSSNAFAITANGNVAVVPFAPFGNTSMYSTTSVGGSGYFDGTGDYLSVANNAALQFGTGDFAVQFWIYQTSLTGYQTPYSLGYVGGGDFLIQTGNGNGLFKVFIGGNEIVAETGTGVANSWNHIVVSRVGTTLRIFRNGSQTGSATDSSNINSSSTLTIGSSISSPAFPITGYMSGVQVLKGSGYTSVTVPTSPPTNITNTSLLCNFTNAGIYDQAAKNDMETAGNAQVSTSVIKYGNSMYFDGTDDYLAMPNSSNFDMGSGEFTIEGWMYQTSSTGNQTICAKYEPSYQASWYIGTSSTNWDVYTYYGSTSNLTVYTGAAPSLNTWHHVALVRCGDRTMFYVDGVQLANVASQTMRTTTSGVSIGRTGAGYTGYFYGYLSNVRITKGLGRYPYNFTPPTRAFGSFYQAQTLTADPYFDYTTLLLPGSGTNGAQNNTFLDSSSNTFSITRNGNTTQGNFSPFSQANGYWSNNFDGSGDKISFTGSSALTASGDFTFECWIFVRSITLNGGSNPRIITSGSGLTLVLVSSSNYLRVDNDGTGTSPISTANNSISLNTWIHVAVVRSGSTLTAYLNGTSAGTATHSSTFTETGSIGIGYDNSAGGYFDGFISNMRMVIGTAIYTSNFTPSTTPLTSVSGTQLLTCQSNRFIDNGPNTYALTPAGDTSVQQFCPFNPTAAWSAATNGGSGYFDGTGDFLQSGTDITLSGNFTVEAWIWTATANQKPEIWVNGGQVGQFVVSTNFNAADAGVIFGATSPPGSGWSVGLAGSTALTPNAWNHVAWVRSSSTITVYLNGASGGTLSNSSNSLAMSKVGAWDASTYDFAGYISSLRVSSVARTITVPTAPYTNEANTTLLLNFTNAGITDATAKNDLETVGNAQISNGAAKFGSTSMYFDGNGDYLTLPHNQLFDFGAGDFTVEFWMYPTAAGQSSLTYIYCKSVNGNYGPILIGQAVSGYGIVLYASSNGSSWDLSNGSSFGTAPQNTWTHIALCRYGPNVFLFLNGTLTTTLNWSTTAVMSNTSPVAIGNANVFANTYYTGYLQDLRVTKGIARYTQNFTPPTAAFQLL